MIYYNIAFGQGQLSSRELFFERKLCHFAILQNVFPQLQTKTLRIQQRNGLDLQKTEVKAKIKGVKKEKECPEKF